MKKTFSFVRFISSVFVCQLAGVLGGLFTAKSVSTWYIQINKPSFTPPSWVFSPVWITLYFLMGVSLYLIWQEGWEKRLVRFGVSVFLIHLILNVLWSYLFFGLQSPFFAFFGIIALWFFILWVLKIFYRINRWSAYILIPYLLWVTFAAVLNFNFLLLN